MPGPDRGTLPDRGLSVRTAWALDAGPSGATEGMFRMAEPMPHGLSTSTWYRSTGEPMKAPDPRGVRSMPVVLPWAMKQLERVRETRPELVDRAIERLLKSDGELRWSVVLSAYLDHEINLGKAAELLELHELELRQRFRDLGIPLRQGSANVAEARAEADALAAWFSESPPPGS